MHITTYRGEASLPDLVHRLFKIEGPRAEMRAKTAGEALLRVNPHLGDLSSVAEGTMIVVPDVPGIGLAAQPEAPAPPWRPQVEQALPVLEPLMASLEATAVRRIEEAERTLKSARSEHRRALARPDEEERERLAKRVVESEARLNEATAIAAAQKEVRARMEEDLKNLRSLLESRSR